MTRMAHVLGAAGEGGAELFYERLTAALARAGDDVLPVMRHSPARARRMQAAGLAPVQLGFGGMLDLATTWRLRGVLSRFAPRIVVAWMNRAARHTPTGPWVLAGRLGGYYDLRYYRRCDHLIGNTQAIVDWITAQGWNPARVHHLPNFAPDLAGVTPSRPEMPPGAKLVVAAGRLHRNKAFDVLIRALPRLPGVHAMIAGEGPERASLQALARAEGVAERVHLPGWRTDTAALIAGCDVFVCPSRHEPLGNVVIEAFSAARPVVATLSDGPRALVEDGRTGRLVPIEDPAALAEAIASLLEDPAATAHLAAAGRAEYEAVHAEAAVVARWRAALLQMEKT